MKYFGPGIYPSTDGNAAFWFIVSISSLIIILVLLNPVLSIFNKEIKIKFIQAFDGLKNGKKIFTFRPPSDELAMFNSVRAFSFF